MLRVVQSLDNSLFTVCNKASRAVGFIRWRRSFLISTVCARHKAAADYLIQRLFVIWGQVIHCMSDYGCSKKFSRLLMTS